jgi:hypothetical protein
MEPETKERVLMARFVTAVGGLTMGRGLLLWLIGIPIPIILLVWALGGLH